MRKSRVWIAASCGTLAIAGLGGGVSLASGSAPKLTLSVGADCTVRSIVINIYGAPASFRTWKKLKPTPHGATLKINGTTHPLTVDPSGTSYSGHGGGFFSIGFQNVQLSPSALHHDANKRATVTWTSSNGRHTLHARNQGGGHC